MIIGYKLIDRSDGTVAKTWGGVWGICPEIPNPLVLPGGDQVCAPALGAHGHFDLVVWEGVPASEQVEAETQRRIMLRLNTTDINKCLTKQMNAQMRGAELINIKASGGTLTAEQQAEATALQALAETIKAIRSKSNEIEALDPIPADYAADARWQ